MAAPRLVIDLTIEDEDMTRLMAVVRSRTEPASRVERALVLLAYRDDPPSWEWNVSACIIKPCSVVSSEPRPLAHWQRWTTVRGPARRRGSQPRPKHGSCRWPARKRRTLAIRMSCGRRGSWLAMRANMGRLPDTNASRDWCKRLYAKFSTHMPLSRSRYATTWSAAIPNSKRR